MKDKLKKCKRPNVDWYLILKNLQDPFLDGEFWAYQSSHKVISKKTGAVKLGSKNRAAYNVLKRHYSTTAFVNVRWLGHDLKDYPRV